MAQCRTASCKEILQGAPGSPATVAHDPLGESPGLPLGFGVAGDCTGRVPGTQNSPSCGVPSGVQAPSCRLSSPVGWRRGRVPCDPAPVSWACRFSAQGNFSINSIGWRRGHPGSVGKCPRPEGPSPLPLLTRDVASKGRLQFHIRTPGCDPSAPLRNPRWRLLEAPAGSALAASPPSLLPAAGSRPDPAVRASNSALVTDFIAEQFREAALPVFISETFEVCKAYFLPSWGSCSVGLESHQE